MIIIVGLIESYCVVYGGDLLFGLDDFIFDVWIVLIYGNWLVVCVLVDVLSDFFEYYDVSEIL